MTKKKKPIKYCPFSSATTHQYHSEKVV